MALTTEEKQEIVAAVIQGLRDASPPLPAALAAGSLGNAAIAPNSLPVVKQDLTQPIEFTDGQTIGGVWTAGIYEVFGSRTFDRNAIPYPTITYSLPDSEFPAIVHECDNIDSPNWRRFKELVYP